MNNQHDGEYFRQKGYELIMRLGSAIERTEAQSRLAEVMAIRRQTAMWMAQRQRMAA